MEDLNNAKVASENLEEANYTITSESSNLEKSSDQLSSDTSTVPLEPVIEAPAGNTESAAEGESPIEKSDFSSMKDALDIIEGQLDSNVDESKSEKNDDNGDDNNKNDD